MWHDAVLIGLGAILWAIACDLSPRKRDRIAILAFIVAILLGAQYQQEQNEKGRTPAQQEEDAQEARAGYE